ncbi:flagellar hook-basal body complex protein FliE [Paracoccaceae bacterium Fryx2]|nr:flagellar hook-basal body complex protein FliE [Paracoccaceae bacterium Fryx2]
MELNTSLAVLSYEKARSAAAPSPQPGGEAGTLETLVGRFADTLAKGEQTARAAMTGGADPHALIQALAASESAVETVVTVRDKVVEAYQEILRMPV